MLILKIFISLFFIPVRWLINIFECYEKGIGLLWYQKSVIMGRKKIELPSSDSLLSTVSRMLVPEDILKDFEIYGAKESAAHWMIELREKENRIPSELKDSLDVVFDGHPIETLSHSFVCKPIYLKIYRRRYKRSNSERHYSNDYDFTLKGLKMVPELGIFLKEEDRRLSS